MLRTTSTNQRNNSGFSSTQYIEDINKQLNCKSLGIAKGGVALSAKRGQGSELIVEGNVTSGFTFSDLFFKFLKTSALDGVSLMTTGGGKIVGFTCEDFNAYQKLINLYVEYKDNAHQDAGTSLNHRQVENTPSQTSYANILNWGNWAWNILEEAASDITETVSRSLEAYQDVAGENFRDSI